MRSNSRHAASTKYETLKKDIQSFMWTTVPLLQAPQILESLFHPPFVNIKYRQQRKKKENSLSES